MSRTSTGRAFSAALVTLAVAFAAPAASAAAPASLTAAAAAAARKSCSVKVSIAGKRTCLAVGRSCKRKHESKYQSKGYTCKRSANGSYRLARLKQAF